NKQGTSMRIQGIHPKTVAFKRSQEASDRKQGAFMNHTGIQYEDIHHVSLTVTDLARSKTFYQEILGLREIERPAFNFEGAWFGIGSSGRQLHLIVHDGET